MNLLIIESPNKIETITKYLKDKDFKIMATIGHIRDLSKRGLGFDEKTLEPNWIVSSSKKANFKSAKTKKEIIDEIKTVASEADKIYLATDPDREGEAIAWHVYEVLSDKDKAKCFRITFNEITKDAILEALEAPRSIDIRWVQSQFARRILDRLVGYRLSKLVRDKIKGTSAGRVQTVALKFIYDREKEIANFKEKKWWTLDVILENEAKLILREVNKKLNDVKLVQINDEEQGSGIDFKDEASANIIKTKLEEKFEIYAIDDPKEYGSNPREPFKTSTLQQDAINKLYWNVGKVTTIAQHLYEGIKIKGERTALISYPRTDSTRISDTFAHKAKEFVLKKYGDKYYQFRTFGSSKKSEGNVQDAHEAIRVIDPYVTPESLKNIVTKDEYALYKLIWVRTIAAFMTQARYVNTIVRLSNAGNKFYTYNRKLKFDGYKKVYQHYEDRDIEHDIQISNLKINQKLKAKTIEVKEHTSSPPPRYNQASLIKTLDEAGVGRPSTYRSMANMAIERGYARLDSRTYVMLPIGNAVIEGLNQYFPYILDKNFTKEMEEHLDDIATKDEKWKEWVLEFKPKLEKDISKANKEMPEPKPEKVGRKCPKCGAPLIFRNSKKTGIQFIGCSTFPKCKYVEFPNSPQPEILEDLCPLCKKPLLKRTNRRGQPFIGCSGYPKCHYIRKINPDGTTSEIDLTKRKFNKFKKGTNKKYGYKKFKK